MAGGGGQACIRQKPHRSRPKRVKLVPRQRRCAGTSLPDIFVFEVSEIGDDLGRCHAIGDKVDDMGDRDPKAANGGTTCQ
jgi:hypothetical protein